MLYLNPCFSQSREIDSLFRILEEQKEDTNKVKKYLELSKIFLNEGNNIQVLKYASLAKDLSTSINFQKGEANSYNLMGIACKEMGRYPESTNNYLKALAIAEKLKNNRLLFNIYDNLGNLSSDQGEFDKALIYYSKALKINPDPGGKRYIQTFNNIGTVYAEKGDLDSALKCFSIVYANAKANNDPINMEGPIGNIGNIYLIQKDYPSALRYFEEALSISKTIKDKNKIALWLYNIGSVYVSIKNFAQAEKYLKESLAISDSILAYHLSKENDLLLSDLYQNLNKHKLAFEYFQKYVVANDSISNLNNTGKITQLEMAYEFDKKEKEAKLLQEKKDALAKQAQLKNNYIIFSFSLILLLLSLFAYRIYNGFLNKKRANHMLIEQKNVIEEKQKEILDSIRYAKRIQNALLTPEAYIENNLRRLTKHDE